VTQIGDRPPRVDAAAGPAGADCVAPPDRAGSTSCPSARASGPDGNVTRLVWPLPLRQGHARLGLIGAWPRFLVAPAPRYDGIGL